MVCRACLSLLRGGLGSVIFRNRPTCLPAHCVKTLHFIALCYFDLGNYDEAIWYCQEFIRVNPTYREPYFLMARALIELKLNVLVEGVIDAGLKHSTYKKD